MSDQFFWFATRSAGIMAWFAATVSITVGLLIPTRALGRKPTIPWLTDLHRYLGAMAMVFLAVHMVTLWADSFVQFGWSELFVPFAATVPGLSRWSLALGVIAGWLLFAVEASSLLKNHIPARAWHTVHLTSFGVMLAGGVHGIEAGSDTDNRYLLAAAVSVSLTVAILCVVRAARFLTDRKRRFDEELLDEELLDEEGIADRPDFELEFEPDGFDPGWLDDDRFVASRFDEPDEAAAVRRPRAQVARQIPDVPLTSGARLVDTDPGPPDRLGRGHTSERFVRDDGDETPPWLRHPRA